MLGEILHEQVQHAAAGAHLSVPGAVIHPGDPGIENGPGAHGAWLQGHIQGAIVQPPGTQGFICLADGLHLRMGAGVLLLLPAVAAPAYYLPIPHDDAAHGHLAALRRLPGQSQGLAHIAFVIHTGSPSLKKLRRTD